MNVPPMVRCSKLVTIFFHLKNKNSKIACSLAAYIIAVIPVESVFSLLWRGDGLLFFMQTIFSLSFLIVHVYVTRGHYTVGHILSPKLIGFAELHL